MPAFAILKSGAETRQVIDGSPEYFELTDAGWDIIDIIGESEAEEERRLAEEAAFAATQARRDLAERLATYARSLGLTANVQWSSGKSVYVTAGNLKLRVSDHQALYRCNYSISPDEGDEDGAMRLIADHDAEEDDE
jgi:hypothetical protein